MRKIRLLFLTGLLALGALPMFAVKGEMRASLRDGTTVTVELTNGMNGTIWTLYEAGSPLNLLVYSGTISFDDEGQPYEEAGNPEAGQNPGKIHFNMEVDKISDLSFTGLVSVDEIRTGTNVCFDIKNGIVSISGVESPIDVTVHSVSGQLQYEERVSSDCRIDIRALGTGVHIVKAGSSTFKILTK